ncbi:PKD domain-containing protein [Halorussus caseinilyticus]|uniref:PKD domain-containing protein n=1 Tax=Halorussus caseinilyticus TaxID=3034025 RepID=A0ABD5WL40_9EURY|nr:PKD domain-containing protein [Halorussus sp. DT72]
MTSAGSGNTLVVALVVGLLLLSGSVPSGALASNDPARPSSALSPDDGQTRATDASALQASGTYTYRLPFSLSEQKLSGAMHSKLRVTAAEATTVQIDANADGTFEETKTVSAGEGFGVTKPAKGAVLKADKPLDARYSYGSADFGAYEDGRFRYRLPAARKLGQEYYAPLDAGSLWIGAASDVTVRIDRDGDGQFDATKSLAENEVTSVSEVSAGAHVEATGPVHVVAKRARWNNMDYTYLVSLLPVAYAKSSYQLPGEPDYNANNPTSKSGVYLAATTDGTAVSLDVGGDGTDRQVTLNAGEVTKFEFARASTVSASAPVVPVYTYHVRATDWWGSETRDYIGAFTPGGDTDISQGEWSGKHWDGGIDGLSAFDYEPNRAPSAAVAYGPTAPAVGQQVTFDASRSSDADGTVAEYRWDFGGGATARGERVSHAFAAAGTHTVELTVVDDDGATVTTTKSVAVSPPVTTTVPITTTTTTATTTTSVGAPTTTTTPPPSGGCRAAPPKMQAVQLHTEDTRIETGDPGRISGSIATDITNDCPIKVQLTLKVPNGVRIEGGSDIQSGGGGLVTSTFTVEPGEVKSIDADVYGSSAGRKVVHSSITYFPVGRKDLAREADTGSLQFVIRPDSGGTTTDAAMGDSSEKKTERDTDGDGIPDSEDYAPKDPDVQVKSDLGDDGDSTSVPGFTPVTTVAALVSAALLLLRRR